MGFFQCGLFSFINATLIHLLRTEQMFRLDGYRVAKYQSKLTN